MLILSFECKVELKVCYFKYIFLIFVEFLAGAESPNRTEKDDKLNFRLPSASRSSNSRLPN